jgi:crotonobetainyl-CoA:carnitine CoA-transferase CaiB-like acyl-CoA transferase
MPENNAMLAPYKVLDLTDEWGYLCGRLLADLGADVIKIERPGGDAGRNIGPFLHDIPHPEKSLYWFFYNANKRSVTLNLESMDGKEIFRKMVKKADFVIESFQPSYMDKLGLGYGELSRINPRVILTSISPFGQEGPYSQFKGSDIASMALGGWLYKCGDPDRPPVQMGSRQACHQVSAQAAAATLMAHYSRERTGEGQQVDASPLPWIAYFAQSATRWYFTKNNERRHGQLWEWSSRPLVRYVWECKDGAVCFSIMGGARFERTQAELVAWMETEGMAPAYLKEINWQKLDYGAVSQEFRDKFEEPIVEFFKKKTKAEIFAESARRGIVLFPAYNAKEIAEDPQLEARNYWVKMEHPDGEAEIQIPGAFFRSSEASWSMKRRAPLIGEHNIEVYCQELGFSREELILLKENSII